MANLYPLLGIFVIGYLLKRASKDYSKELIDLVIWVFLPAFILNLLKNISLDSDIVIVIGLGFLSVAFGLGLAFLAYKLLALDKKTAACLMLVSSVGQTGFLGIPYISAFYGDEGLRYAIFFDEISTVFSVIILGIFLSNWGNGQSFEYKKALKDVLFFPPVVAIVLALSVGEVFNNSFLEMTLDMLASVLIPSVILAIGMRFSIVGLKGNLLLTKLSIFIKMVLMPFFIYWCARVFFEADDIALKATVVEAAMPPMVLASVFAIKGGLNPNLAISSVALGMIISFVIIPFLYTIV